MNNLVRTTLSAINQHFIPFVPLRLIHLFKFGLETLSLPKFESLNSNARIWGGVDSRSTAESKMYRLLKNETLQRLFPKILKTLGWISPQSVIIVDFSTFTAGWLHPEFQVLTFGLQTFLGRAIPLFFDIIRYPIKKEGSQNIFIISAVKQFKEIFGFYPQFVLDRGFAVPALVEFFIGEGITFYVRSKSGKVVKLLSMREITNIEELDKLIPAGKIKEKDVTVKVYGQPLRLVISDHNGKHKEPWFILTNDFTSSRKQVLETYYHRFEIEETFKDLKHLKSLEKTQIKSERSFRTTLWFMIIGCWLAYLVQITYQNSTAALKGFANDFYRRTQLNAHKTLSLFRSFFEAVQRCFYFVHAYLTRKSHFR